MTHKIRQDLAKKILGRMNGQTLMAGHPRSGSIGRTITEIVEHDPGQVSEVWCRKILRQLLQFLERQYAMRLPHRIITPDTVIVGSDGEPTLITSRSAPRPDLARDLTALARVIHYAITQERVPARPLRGRPLTGYSNSLLAAIDRSLDPDPGARPHTIEDLRALLGIVGRQEVVRVHGARKESIVPASELHPSSIRPQNVRRPGDHHWPQWILPAGAAIMVGVFLGVLGASGGFTSFDDNGLFQEPKISRADPDERSARPAIPSLPDHPSPPLTSGIQKPAPSNGPLTSGQEPEALKLPERMNASNTPGNSKPSEPTRQKNDFKPLQHRLTDKHPQPPPVAADPARTVQDLPLPAARPMAGNTVLELRIQPWGVVYIDGIDRGLSPPLKRLTVAPGRHSVLVKNPSSGTRTFQVDTAQGNGVIAVDFNDLQK